jgi:hypothetical protein
LHKWAPEFAGTRKWEMIASDLRSAMKTWHGRDILTVSEFMEGEKSESTMPKRSARSSECTLLLIAKYKSICRKIILTEITDHPAYHLDDKFQESIDQEFAKELRFFRQDPENVHLVIMGEFSFNLELETSKPPNLGGMLVNENWLPFENEFDKQIVDELTAANRHLTVRGLL